MIILWYSNKSYKSAIVLWNRKILSIQEEQRMKWTVYDVRPVPWDQYIDSLNKAIEAVSAIWYSLTSFFILCIFCVRFHSQLVCSLVVLPAIYFAVHCYCPLAEWYHRGAIRWIRRVRFKRLSQRWRSAQNDNLIYILRFTTHPLLLIRTSWSLTVSDQPNETTRVQRHIEESRRWIEPVPCMVLAELPLHTRLRRCKRGPPA